MQYSILQAIDGYLSLSDISQIHRGGYCHVDLISIRSLCFPAEIDANTKDLHARFPSIHCLFLQQTMPFAVTPKFLEPKKKKIVSDSIAAAVFIFFFFSLFQRI